MGGKYLENRNKPMPGELYRHFKGNLYQILAVAIHTETREELVVYQALYGDYGIYARPITMFMSKVDTVKYAEVTAVYRFELFKTQGGVFLSGDHLQEHTSSAASIPLEQIDITNDGSIQLKTHADVDIQKETIGLKAEAINAVEIDSANLINEDGISSILIEFLDATTFREKLEIVQSHKKDLNDKIINNMAMSIDCTVIEGDMEDRISSLTYCLQTRIRFESRRLR
ncbi:MAG: hypothetical protein K0S61_788 [Anaerocolumna sp.]|jgi:hypothetical protein|nr:hypothetical protein [Anaerocolumna sp.]